MNRLLLILFIFSVLGACKPETREQETEEKTENQNKSGQGGTIRINFTETYETLLPYSISDIRSSNIALQIYEGLVKINPKDLSVVPGIAERWEADTAGKVYTFYLRKGVKFHDHAAFEGGKGREVKAADVKYSFDQLCTPSKKNFQFAGTFKDIVKGANEHYAKPAEGGVAGVEALDDYTVRITLQNPTSTFLYRLALPGGFIIPREVHEKETDELKTGTGPFIVASGDTASRKLVLVKNPSYYKTDEAGTRLPYLDSLVFTFLDSKREELEQFEAGNLDILVGLPSESIKDVVEKKIQQFENKPPQFILDRAPELQTQLYFFNTTHPVLKNKKVRQAISYAVNRQKIVDDILRGEAYAPGSYGIIPPSLKNYNAESIKGYQFNPQQAKRLLAEAGYPDGNGFPALKLQVNTGGAKYANVAFEVVKQLRDHLNINLDLEIVPFGTILEDAKFGRSDIFRSGWQADYPAAENFLLLFYGKNVPSGKDQPSFPNMSRYVNPEFDRLYEQALATKDEAKKFELFRKAEQLAMNDAPVLVLWYVEKYRLYRSDINNFFPNSLNYWDFSTVYRKPVKSAIK